MGGFACTESVITPYGRNAYQLYDDKHTFNFYHSSTRMHIEQAFGQLKSRWGILWRPLACNLYMNHVIIHGCMMLHNFIAQQRQNPTEELDLPAPIDARIQEDTIFPPELSSRAPPRHESQRPSVVGRSIRTQLTQALVQKGKTYPTSAM